MSIYVASDSERDLWVTYFDDTEVSSVYAWVPELGRFVRHGALTSEFYFPSEFSQELKWTLIIGATREFVESTSLADGLSRRMPDFMARLTAETDIRTLEDVFGPLL